VAAVDLVNGGAHTFRDKTLQIGVHSARRINRASVFWAGGMTTFCLRLPC